MEWFPLQHLDLRGHKHKHKQHQQSPQCGAFHHSQALFAAALDKYILEFDALTGCKLSTIDIGAPVVQMSYSPAGGHIVIAVLEDGTIRSCDFDTEHTFVLYSPEKKADRLSSGTEVHIALTPLQPVVFFGLHRRLSVTVVGTVEGGRPPTKIKTDLKKPVVNLACHPRSPLLYVAYVDGLVRAYNIQSFTVHYTLQIDNSIKLLGAGAFAFHSTLEWVFIGDRSGTLLAWDVSVTARPNMIGITQVGEAPIVAVGWHSMQQFLITLSKDGSLNVWRTRVIINSNKPPMRANFFEAAGIESMDMGKILSQQGGETVYPLPRIKDFLLHPKLNLATVLFLNDAIGDDLKLKGVSFSREARKQLFAVLQSARGSPGPVLKEKLSLLGSTGNLAGHHLQLQLQVQQAKGQNQLTASDIARKAFLHSHLIGGHAKIGPVLCLPLLSIADKNHPLRDIPVCQPFQLDLNFFNKGHRTLHYPVRAFFMDGCNLMAYNLSTAEYNIYKKLSSMAVVGNEWSPKRILYSAKQHLFVVFFEVRGGPNEVVLYRDLIDSQSVTEKMNTTTGCDGALIGPMENQYAILDDDHTSLTLHFLDVGIRDPIVEGVNGRVENNGAIDANSFTEPNSVKDQAPLHFVFENKVERIFSTPLESTILYVCSGSHVAFAKLFQDTYRLSRDNGLYLSTNPEPGKHIKLKANETVIQVQWQETQTGQVAGILTTRRIMITSQCFKFCFANIHIISLLWVGPALLFSTATAVGILGWDGIPRSIITINTPYAALVGALNDRVLLACAMEANPRQKQAVEIKTCLVGLLEPLLIGWATMQQKFEPKLDLSEILYQLTSRFDSLRLTPRSVDVLANGPPVCGDLAVALAQSGPQFTQVLRCNYAIKAHRFLMALSILKDEFLRSRDYPECPPTSRLFQRFRQLGQACIKYGQFDSAKETFEVVSDYESMLDLFICHLNPSSLRRVAQKLEDTDAESELRRQCERILRVRSSGWTQGIFANFAAESMVPKGPEWGGGNWEIKTPPESKNIPQWELSGEVMPYMRTSAGPIPSIIADNIGVYLGTTKGRGTVIDVKEDSLRETFAAGMNNERKSEESNLVLFNPEPSQSSRSDEVSVKRTSVSGSSSLSKAFEVDTAKDEQTKAAEEFKKSLYGADDSSSEEDEAVSKRRTIRFKIQDKPITGTVDVNKVKEATKQFKLGDALPPPGSRTRSSSGGSQDLSIVLAPPSISGPQNGTITGAISEPTSLMVGMGVSAGPIPEDFFQNTISSFQAAASLPSVAAYNQSQNQMFQGTASNRVPPNNQGLPVDFGLPGGGVPPQIPESTSMASSLYVDGTPPQFVGLPDGGVPPVSVSSTPLDTSVLELASKNTAETQVSGLGAGVSKTPGRPGSPPIVVRPGQVPRGAAASKCFKAGVAHLEQNQLSDAMSCLDEAFLALAKDQSLGRDIKAQAAICAQYKIAVSILQEIVRLQRVQGPSAVSAKEEMARLSRHLGTLPLLAKHRISCIRTAIKRNMDVQNYAFAKSMLDLLLSKAPPNKQDELRSLISVCMQRGLTDKSIDPAEDASQFCAATLGRLPTIGHDACDLCGAKFSALSSPGCIICGMGSIKRSDAVSGPVPSPFG
ncbi:hypothetical protein SUGI_0927300 [Cryptomeria japonica]|nr:hypothetical protein SUGI_0927300 [Cryptomeria japonica]